MTTSMKAKDALVRMLEELLVHWLAIRTLREPPTRTLSLNRTTSRVVTMGVSIPYGTVECHDVQLDLGSGLIIGGFLPFTKRRASNSLLPFFI